jgi:putative FmdB family regulatory protein
MPIYAYKCESCGFAKDVLQKMSDAPLTDCPTCGKPSFQKQVTAAGFQLKGSGWYVTDFKGNGSAPATATAPATAPATGAPSAAGAPGATGNDTAPAAPSAPAAASGKSEAAATQAAKPAAAAD